MDGVDPNRGFTTYYNRECSVDIAMIEQSALCIVAADRSKLGHCAFAKISDISVADYIVTNGDLSGEFSDVLAALNVKVIS